MKFDFTDDLEAESTCLIFRLSSREAASGLNLRKQIHEPNIPKPETLQSPSPKPHIPGPSNPVEGSVDPREKCLRVTLNPKPLLDVRLVVRT